MRTFWLILHRHLEFAGFHVEFLFKTRSILQAMIAADAAQRELSENTSGKEEDDLRILK